MPARAATWKLRPLRCRPWAVPAAAATRRTGQLSRRPQRRWSPSRPAPLMGFRTDSGTPAHTWSQDADPLDLIASYSTFFLRLRGNAKMNRLTRIGVAAALATVSAVAVSQAVTKAASQADANKAIEARQAIFKQIKDLNDPIAPMLRPNGPPV